MSLVEDIPAGWMSLTQLAQARGVDKSAISRRVFRLEQLGALATRKVGKAKLINVEQFNQAIAVAGDAVRESNGRSATGPPDMGFGDSRDPVLAREQARRANYDAELKKLDLEERLGRLVEVEAVRSNVESCAGELGRVIDALPARAEALMAAVSKDGVSGLRTALRGVARELREALARAAEGFADGDLDEGDAPSAAEEVLA